MAAAAMSSSQGLPRTTFEKLTPHAFLVDALTSTPGRRSNGRLPHEYRQPSVTTGSLSHAHGSAVVRVGDNTAICGVRGETMLVSEIPNYRPRTASGGGVQSTTLPPTQAAELLRDYDLLVPNIELATGCAPQFLPGVPPSDLAQTLSTRLYSLLHAAALVDVEDLTIWRTVSDVERIDFEGGPGKPADGPGQDADAMEVDRVDDEQQQQQQDALPASSSASETREVVAYWVLFIDVFFISYDGNGLDTAWGALMAALRDTRLPTARWDADAEAVVCSCATAPLPLSLPLRVTGLPFACSAAVFDADAGTVRATTGRAWILSDPDGQEEKLCRETLTVVVDCDGEEDLRIVAVSKHGGTRFRQDDMVAFLERATDRWHEWARALQMMAGA